MQFSWTGSPPLQSSKQLGFCSFALVRPVRTFSLRMVRPQLAQQFAERADENDGGRVAALCIFQPRLSHTAPGPDAHEKIRKTISPLSLLFLSCQPRPDVRHQPPSPSKVLLLLQCSDTMTFPSRPLKDLSTAACSISNSIHFIGKIFFIFSWREGRLQFQTRPSSTLVRRGVESCAKLSSRFRRFTDLQALILPHIAINVHYVSLNVRKSQLQMQHTSLHTS